MIETSDDYLPLRSLNDLLYCDRRCALHRIEGVWTDNAATLEGTFAHKRADKPVTWESASGGREVHGMWLKSDRLRLVGKADVVEFSVGQASSLPFRSPAPPGNALSAGSAGSIAAESLPPQAGLPARESGGGELEATSLPAGAGQAARSQAGAWERGGNTSSDSQLSTLDPQLLVPYPVEYKRGKRKKWDNDEVQLCAQAMCLEEMLGVAVPRGAIFHIKSKRRREVDFTQKLRDKTTAAAARLHELIAAGITPPAVLKPQCDGCSLRAICLPELGASRQSVDAYCRSLLEE